MSFSGFTISVTTYLIRWIRFAGKKLKGHFGFVFLNILNFELHNTYPITVYYFLFSSQHLACTLFFVLYSIILTCNAAEMYRKCTLW